MKRAAVIRASSLGDVVLSTMVVDYLRDRDYSVTFFTGSEYIPLLSSDPRLDGAVNVHGKEVESYFKQFHLVLDLHSTRLSRRIRKQLLIEKEGKLHIWKSARWQRWLHVLTRGKYFRPQHVLRRYHEEAYEKGYRPRIILSRENKSTRDKAYAVIAPGAKWPSKQYAPEHFASIAKMLVEKGLHVVIVFGKGDEKLEPHFRYTGNVDIISSQSLPEIAGILQKAMICICNDSGLAHLSEAVGTPVMVIYTSTAPSLGFTPHLPPSRYVWSGMDCSPCSPYGRKRCLLFLRCRKRIPPKMMFPVIEKMLEETTSQG